MHRGEARPPLTGEGKGEEKREGGREGGREEGGKEQDVL